MEGENEAFTEERAAFERRDEGGSAGDRVFVQACFK